MLPPLGPEPPGSTLLVYSIYQNVSYIYQQTLPGEPTHLTLRMKAEKLNTNVINNIYLCMYVVIYENVEMYHVLSFVTQKTLICSK